MDAVLERVSGLPRFRSAADVEVAIMMQAVVAIMRVLVYNYLGALQMCAPRGVRG